MKLLKLIEPRSFEGGRAIFELQGIEIKDEMQRLHEIQEATVKTLFTSEKLALHNLIYKRNIKLDDGRILKHAWCRELTLNDDNSTTGEFIFAEIEEAK